MKDLIYSIIIKALYVSCLTPLFVVGKDIYNDTEPEIIYLILGIVAIFAVRGTEMELMENNSEEDLV